MEFLLSSAEAQLLVQFEQTPSLESLAKALNRDPTAISRQLKRVSEKGDFLTKISGRWKLTEVGKRYNQATRDYLFSQNRIVSHELHLKIGSTREFSSRVLAPNVGDLKLALGVDSISLISYEGSIEKPLLAGEIDLGFDCGRPYSADIGYKRVLDEPISPVVSSKIFKSYSKIQHFKELEDYPHILCDRLNPDRVSKTAFTSKTVTDHCNDIAIAIKLCLAHDGWALLPVYTIKEELQSKKLKIIGDMSFSSEKFGVWFLRERKGIAPFYRKAVEWAQQSQTLMI